MDGLSLTTAGWVVLAVIVLALLAVVVRYFISVAMEFTRVLACWLRASRKAAERHRSEQNLVVRRWGLLLECSWAAMIIKIITMSTHCWERFTLPLIASITSRLI